VLKEFLAFKELTTLVDFAALNDETVETECSVATDLTIDVLKT